MQRTHTIVWCCLAPGHELNIYDSPSELEEHLRAEHSDSFNENQLPSLIQRGAKPAPDTLGVWANQYIATDIADPPSHSCPLCHKFRIEPQNESEGNSRLSSSLYDHLFEHLETIALLSLPESAAIEHVKSNTQQSRGSRRSTVQNIIHLPLPEFEDEIAQRSDPFPWPGDLEDHKPWNDICDTIRTQQRDGN